MASISAALQAASKSHKSAVALVPPRSAWSQIQAVRVFNDKSFARWPPHVNLLYPFVEEQHFESAAQAAAEALAGVRPFQVSLREFGHFEHHRSCTLWLRPEGEELLAVQGLLERAFPQCTDLSSDASRGIDAFHPHLSLGQWRTPADVAAASARLAASWQPIGFQAGGLALLSRRGFDDPFSLRYFVPFGGGAPVAADVPYIATAGDALQLGGAEGSEDGAGAGLVELLGIGAARSDGTVWNFAYGANMCPSKLLRRDVHPLESLPASLPGWRLSFTHRGGMGDLTQLAPGEAGPAGLGAVHGVLHRLSPSDYGRLANMEHEYLPTELAVQPYGGGSPVPAVAFLTPPDRRIADGLPPPQRYLGLLQEGAAHWRLDPDYARWLGDMRGVEQRGDAYYTSADGRPLDGLPKIRTGSQPQRGGARQGSRRGGGQGRGQGRQQQRQPQRRE